MSNLKNRTSYRTITQSNAKRALTRIAAEVGTLIEEGPKSSIDKPYWRSEEDIAKRWLERLIMQIEWLYR